MRSIDERSAGSGRAGGDIDLTAVPGLGETTLAPELAARLPAWAPPAPWELELRALLWMDPPGRRGARDLPAELGPGTRATVGGGGLVNYLATPVGPYREVFAAALILHAGRPAVHVPFMAVDSTESLVGGRSNWSLPKTLFELDGDPGADAVVSARGEGWAVRVRSRRLGPSLPFRARFGLVQAWSDGSLRRAAGRMAGRARLARVEVELCEGATLPEWVAPGRRLALRVEHARGTLGPARRLEGP